MNTKKSKKNKKRKLGSLLLLLFLTIVLLTTSTYAWFTSNRTVTVGGLDVNVSSANGLLISSTAADGSWKALLETADLSAGYSVTSGDNTAKALNQLPTTMVPVSTINAVTDGKLTMYKGKLENDVLTASLSEEKAGSTGDFISFDVFLKLDEASPVYLSVGSGVKSTAASSRGLQYATRMAIINEGTLAATSTQYNLVTQNGGTSAIILEPNYDGHTSYGIQNAAYYQKYTYASTLTAGTGNGIVSWDGIKAAIDVPGIGINSTNATDNGTSFAKVEPTIATTEAFSASAESEKPKLLFSSLPAGVTKLHVYMWVEGQDIDCQNNASGSDLTYLLSFTLDDGTTPTA